MKNKATAGFLALILGGFGFHKFYLGSIGWGLIYLAFCWTYIPSIIGFIEAIIIFATSDADFDKEYNSQGENMLKKCPECAEYVKPDAKKCRYCGYIFEIKDEFSIFDEKSTQK